MDIGKREKWRMATCRPWKLSRRYKLQSLLELIEKYGEECYTVKQKELILKFELAYKKQFKDRRYVGC